MHLLIFFKMHWGKVDVDNSVLQKLLFLEKKKRQMTLFRTLGTVMSPAGVSSAFCVAHSTVYCGSMLMYP